MGLSASRWGGGEPASGAGSTTPVVVAAADLAAGSIVSDPMLTTGSLPSTVNGLVTDPVSLRGRVLVVPVVRGEPVGLGMTAPRPTAAGGHRLIRVSVGAIDVAPDVVAGGHADVVASFQPATPGQKPEVSVVATVRVVALEQHAESGVPQGAPDAASTPAQPGSPLGSTTAATLDCQSADALRVLWAKDNARVLRLLAHPEGDASPPAVAAAA